MDDHTIAAMEKRYQDFYFETLKATPNLAFVVINEGGAQRWNFQRMGAKQDINVVGTKTGGLLPIRDHHIYRVLDLPPGAVPDQPDSITTEVGQMIHRSMCGAAKFGHMVTVGEIIQASKAQVAARASMVEASKAEIVKPTGSADHPDTKSEGEKVQRKLPKTAVQIVKGDTVVSEPFDTQEDAKNSEQWATLQQLPEVVSGQTMVWLHPVFPEE